MKRHFRRFWNHFKKLSIRRNTLKMRSFVVNLSTVFTKMRRLNINLLEMDIFGKLFKLELICLKLLGYQFEYLNTKKDLLMKFWSILCIFSHFLIPTLALFNLAVNGFTKDFIQDSILLTHSIVAGLKIMVFLSRRKALKKLMQDSETLHEKGENLENYFSNFAWKFLLVVALLEDPEITKKWDTSSKNQKRFLFSVVTCAVSLTIMKGFKQAFSKNTREFPIKLS